jgi:membrane protein involved in colicin uptake
VLPPWLAHLTPWIDDDGTAAAWPGFVGRYVAVLRSWNLDAAQSQRCDYLCRALIVREARNHTTAAVAIAACDTVIALCDRAAAGSLPPAQEWAAAARDAANAAWDAAWAAASAAAWAAEAAAEAGAASDAASDAAWDAARAAGSAAARAAASDRMIDGILTVLETEIAHGPRGEQVSGYNNDGTMKP